jgi:hypothetical protein
MTMRNAPFSGNETEQEQKREPEPPDEEELGEQQ